MADAGGHFNPAVTLGVAASALYLVATGVDGFSATGSGFASNGYGDRSPGGYSLLSALVIEIVLTPVFLYAMLLGKVEAAVSLPTATEG